MVKIIGNITTKILAIMIIFGIVFMPISNAGYWDDIINSANEFIATGSDADGSAPAANQDKIYTTVNTVYYLLLALGVVTSVIVGAVLGIKYMTGSIEQQAKIKETLIPFVLGCVVVFGAFGIWKILINVLAKV